MKVNIRLQHLIPDNKRKLSVIQSSVVLVRPSVQCIDINFDDVNLTVFKYRAVFMKGSGGFRVDPLYEIAEPLMSPKTVVRRSIVLDVSVNVSVTMSSSSSILQPAGYHNVVQRLRYKVNVTHDVTVDLRILAALNTAMDHGCALQYLVTVTVYSYSRRIGLRLATDPALEICGFKSSIRRISGAQRVM